MKGLKIGLLIFAALLLILFVAGLLFPSDYEVKRSVTIQANSQTVLDSLLNLKTWPQWSPWRQDGDDPTLQFRTSGTPAMPGYTLHWQSEQKGVGQIKIEQINQAEGMRYELESGGETLVQNGFLQIEALGDSTQLTWTVTGRLGGSPIMRWAGLFIDGSLGPAYQQSLEDFKKRVEDVTNLAEPNVITPEYLGQWRIVGYKYAPISAMDDAQAQAYVGVEVLLDNTIAKIGTDECEDPTYVIEVESLNTFYEMHRIEAEEFGFHTEPINHIFLECTERNYGLLYDSEGHYYLSTGGVYFTLEKIQ